jgi:WD40 repeat protein
MEILEVGPDIVNFFELDKQRICCCCVSQLKVWDVTNGECLTSINIDDSWADILKINDSLVYVITHSDEISVWDINSWECLKAREVEYGIIFGDKKIVLMNGNLLVFTLLADGVGTYMKIWDRCSLDCLQTIVLEHDVSQMIEIYCGTVSVSFVNSLKIQIFDVEDGKLLRSLVCTSGSISYFSKLKDGRMLAVGDRLTIWNVDTWECECVLEPSVDGHFTSALQISDGRIVSFSYDPSAFNMWTIQ